MLEIRVQNCSAELAHIGNNETKLGCQKDQNEAQDTYDYIKNEHNHLVPSSVQEIKGAELGLLITLITRSQHLSSRAQRNKETCLLRQLYDKVVRA